MAEFNNEMPKDKPPTEALPHERHALKMLVAGAMVIVTEVTNDSPSNGGQLKGSSALSNKLSGSLSMLSAQSTMLSAQLSGQKESTTIPPQYEQLKDVFGLAEQSRLPEHNLFDHSIDLIEGKKSPFGPLYPMSLTELKALRDYVTKNLEAGLIHHSSSSAASAMMFVPKKDGTLRPVVDY